MLSEKRFKQLARLLYSDPRLSANKIACLPEWDGAPPTAAQMARVKKWLAAKEARQAAKARPKAEWTNQQKVAAWLSVWAVVGLLIVGGIAYLIWSYPAECLACLQFAGTLLVVAIGGYIGMRLTPAKAPNASRFNGSMVCPHCQHAGVQTEMVMRKKGVSGGKATAAVLTGGASLLAVGLSRSEQEMRCHCPNCGTTWHIG